MSLIPTKKVRPFRPDPLSDNNQNFTLPIHNLINNQSLLRTAFPQIYPCGFNVFMPHKVCQQCDIIKAVKECFGEQMAEGMGVNNYGINVIPDGKAF